MKTKLFLFILLVLSGFSDAFAFQLVISGGTRRNTYNYVRATNQSLTCTGRGYNPCPVNFWSTGETQRVAAPSDVCDKVLALWNEGKQEGTLSFDENLEVKWWTNDEKDVTIDMNYPEGSISIDEELLKQILENDGK